MKEYAKFFAFVGCVIAVPILFLVPLAFGGFSRWNELYIAKPINERPMSRECMDAIKDRPRDLEASTWDVLLRLGKPDKAIPEPTVHDPDGDWWYVLSDGIVRIHIRRAHADDISWFPSVDATPLQSANAPRRNP